MFIIAETCILCLIGINQFFIYEFNIMDLHRESTGKYYDELVETRNNIVANSNLMNTILGVVALFLLSMFVVYGVICWGKSDENHSEKG